MSSSKLRSNKTAVTRNSKSTLRSAITIIEGEIATLEKNYQTAMKAAQDQLRLDKANGKFSEGSSTDISRKDAIKKQIKAYTDKRSQLDDNLKQSRIAYQRLG